MKTATVLIAVALITLAILAATLTAQAELLHKHNYTRDTQTTFAMELQALSCSAVTSSSKKRL